MTEPIRYESRHKQKWNDFLEKSINGNFLFNRDYMDYHQHRIQDYSLMIVDDDKIIALLPASISGSTVISHGGLTFGGFVYDHRMKTSAFLKIFEQTVGFLKKNSIDKFIYKPVPNIYRTIPKEFDLYCLFLNNAGLIRRDISSCINLKHDIIYSRGKKWGINKARKLGLTYRQSNDFIPFMEIVKKNLSEKYKVTPTHTSEEIAMLADRFPKNIKLFCAYSENKMLAGTILYIHRHLVHAQYMGSDEMGKEYRALDFLLDELIHRYKTKYTYFDFGISNENQGRYLNTGLIDQKEEFGAGAVCHDFYEINLKHL